MYAIKEETKDDLDLEADYKTLTETPASDTRNNPPIHATTNSMHRFFYAPADPNGPIGLKKCSAVFFSLMFIFICSVSGESVSSKFFHNETGYGYGAGIALILLFLYKKCFLDRDNQLTVDEKSTDTQSAVVPGNNMP